MPLIKALFTRCGQPIPMRVDKFEYLFTENPYGDFVASVSAEEHVNHMLQTGNFELYTPPTAEELAVRQAELRKGDAKASARNQAREEQQAGGHRK